MLAMDVTNDASLVAVVDEIIRGEGRIDVLINNAGYGCYGAIEDVPLAEARRQFDVNVFGLARLTQLVLPHMRARRCGRIINISSIPRKSTRRWAVGIMPRSTPWRRCRTACGSRPGNLELRWW